MTTCSVSGCPHSVRAKGLCASHYDRLRVWGDVRPEVPLRRCAQSGKSRTAEYFVWFHMRERTRNPKAKDAPSYSWRGIKVCKRWEESFEAFLADMGKRPGPEYTIERINNDAGYEPSNCRWATRLEQANNRRSSRLIEFAGKKLSIPQWSRELGIHHGTLDARLRKGWSVARTFTTPADIKHRKKQPELNLQNA